jgi:putative flippase GtrA
LHYDALAIMSASGIDSRTSASAQLFRYCVVGGCGFAVEAAVIAFLQYAWQWSALPCRAVSFPCAVLVTWWLNHRYTFRSAGGWGEVARYFSTQGVGLVTNLLAYAAMIQIFPLLDRHALVPLVVGSALGLSVNFLLAKRWAFAARKNTV